MVFSKQFTQLYKRKTQFILKKRLLSMNDKDNHTTIGIVSIIFGILGIIFYFIGLFFYTFMDNRLYGIVAGIILSIIAIVCGYIAKKQDDNYGSIGMFLGFLVIIIAIITVLLTTPVTVVKSYS